MTSLIKRAAAHAIVHELLCGVFIAGLFMVWLRAAVWLDSAVAYSVGAA